MDVALLMLLALHLSTASPAKGTYDAAMGREIEDDVLRKFYLDMDVDRNSNLESTQPETVGHSFNIDDYYDDSKEPEYEAEQDAIDHDLSDLSTDQIRAALQAAVASSTAQHSMLSSASPPVHHLQAQEDSPVAATPATGSEDVRDAAYVLSRLLFHMSQLPTLI